MITCAAPTEFLTFVVVRRIRLLDIEWRQEDDRFPN